MAIVQISRITNRKGLQENLPQLAGAELGWAQDTRRLYIGNGTLQDGAPVIGNTEILTEFSDITVLSNYTYEDVAVGYTAQTGLSPSTPVIRSVQAKLDDFASVRDYGAIGDGTADDTAAINHALFDLYCRDTNTQIRRSLYFPAGTYRITDTLLIPTFAKLVGEGANCSIILLTESADYVARYADSLQQTGADIGNNGAIVPQNIEISSMSFQSTVETDIFSVDQGTQCWFDSVDFTGPITQSQIINSGSTALPEISAVSFFNGGALVTNDITFDKCGFYNITYAVNTDIAIRGITISNGKFNLLYQGVVLTGGGPTGVRVVHNMFNNIYAEGVVYGDVNINSTAYNVFYNVGFAIGSSSPVSPVISFANDTSVSINDLFQRSDSDNYISPRISIVSGGTPSGGSSIQLGRYSRDIGRTFTLLNNQITIQPIITINKSNVKAFNVDYTIVRDTAIRHGVLTVAAGSTTNFTDDFTEISSTGITLSVVPSGSAVVVGYSSTNTGISGTITYSISHLA